MQEKALTPSAVSQNLFILQTHQIQGSTTKVQEPRLGSQIMMQAHYSQQALEQGDKSMVMHLPLQASMPLPSSLYALIIASLDSCPDGLHICRLQDEQNRPGLAAVECTLQWHLSLPLSSALGKQDEKVTAEALITNLGRRYACFAEAAML